MTPSRKPANGHEENPARGSIPTAPTTYLSELREQLKLIHDHRAAAIFPGTMPTTQTAIDGASMTNGYSGGTTLRTRLSQGAESTFRS